MVTLSSIKNAYKNYDDYTDATKNEISENNKAAQEYLYNLFAPDNRRYDSGKKILTEELLGQFLGNVGLDLSLGLAGSSLKSLGSSAKNRMKKLKNVTFHKARKRYANLSGEIIRKNKELYKRAFLLPANDPARISVEEFIAGLLNNNRKANSIFMSFTDADQAADFMKSSLKNIPEQVLGKDARDKIAEKWVKGKLNETDIREILRAGQTAWDPIVLFIHSQTTGDTFRKILELPATRFWLKNRGYDINLLYDNADKLGFLHDFGKVFTRPDLLHSNEKFRDMGELGKRYLGEVRKHESVGKEMLEQLFGKEWKKELNKMGFSGTDEAATIFSFFGGEDSLAKFAEGHGVKGNNTPLEILFGIVDQADAIHNKRNYTGNATAMTKESLGKLIHKMFYGDPKYNTTGIRNSGLKYRFDVPDNVLEELKNEMPDIWNSSKVDMDELLGPIENIEKSMDVPLSDKLKLAYGEQAGNIAEKAGNIAETSSRAAQIGKGPIRKAINDLGNIISKTAAESSRLSKLRTDIYDSYRNSIAEDLRENEGIPADKNFRKIADFVLSDWVNPREAMSNVRSKAVRPDTALKYLKQFNENFQGSDYSQKRKDAVQKIVDNFYDLSEDDQSYFMDDLSRRYSDVRNSPNYKYIDLGFESAK